MRVTPRRPLLSHFRTLLLCFLLGLLTENLVAYRPANITTRPHLCPDYGRVDICYSCHITLHCSSTAKLKFEITLNHPIASVAPLDVCVLPGVTVIFMRDCGK